MNPALKRFDTERDLAEYADLLNESGLSPEIPLMDSAGICAFGTLQAPGGDAWGFAYYAVNNGDEGTIQGEETGWVRPARYLSEYRDDWDKQPGWKPAWPVFGIVVTMGGAQ